MRTRTKKGPPKRLPRKAASPSKQPGANWSLLVIDNAPIRKQAKADYDKVIKEINNARQELQQFETLDRPNYQRWFHGQFGALLTELRLVAQKIAVQRDLLFEIESEAFFCGISSAEAYRRIKERMEKNDATVPEPEKDFDDDDWDDDDDSEPFGFNFGEDDEPKSRAGRKSPGVKAKPKIAAQAASRLKELYRMLARRLHPDMQSQSDPQKLHWWHQTQAAYEAGDADQLEIILTWCEMSEQGAAAQTSVSLVKRLTAQFRASLRSLKRQIGLYRQDPAWNFGKRTDLKALAHRTQQRLLDELHQMRRVLNQFEQQVESIAAAASRIKKSNRRRRKTAVDPDEWLF